MDGVKKTHKDVIMFFLRLIGARKKAMATRVEICSKGRTPWGSNYRFSAFFRGEKVTKDIVIRQVGDSSAKSNCFYVNFMGQNVLKISPYVSDMEQYLRILSHEQSIRAKLLGKVFCVVPEIRGVANSLVPRKNRGSEDVAVEEVSKTPKKYEAFFKIGERFVFFVPYVKEGTLEDKIKIEANVNRQRVSGYFQQFPDLLFTLDGFLDEFGDTDEIYDLHEEAMSCYASFCKAAKTLSRRIKLEKNLFESDFRSLFLACFSGSSQGLFGITSEFFEALSDRYDEIVAERPECFSAMSKIQDLVDEKFGKINRQREKIFLADNSLKLLDLLRRISEGGVAFRDFKLGNIIPGDRFGLMDMETAVVVSGNIGQPILGGSPFTVVPAGCAPNEILSEVYGKNRLGHALQMQDWHACMATIFKVVVGRELFFQTATAAKSLYEEFLKKCGSRTVTIADYRDVNAAFWVKASKEFKSQMGENKKILQEANIELSAEIEDFFKSRLGEKNYPRYFGRGGEVSLHVVLQVMFALSKAFYNR